jgi:hypothetical protein
VETNSGLVMSHYVETEWVSNESSRGDSGLVMSRHVETERVSN